MSDEAKQIAHEIAQWHAEHFGKIPAQEALEDAIVTAIKSAVKVTAEIVRMKSDDWIRSSDGNETVREDSDAVIRRLSAENKRLQAEVVEWKIHAGKYTAGCELCEQTEKENGRLRVALIRARNQIGDVAAMPTDTDWIDRILASEPASAEGDKRPITTEALDKAQFGRVLHRRGT